MFTNLMLIAAAVADEQAGEGSGGIFSFLTDFKVDWPFFIAQVVNFCIVAFILYKYAFKPVLATMDQRQKKISDGLQYAEEMKSRLADAEVQHVEKLKEASEEAARIVQEARENAKTFLDKQTQDAISKAEDIVKKANEATEMERQKMLAELRNEVATLVVTTTEKVLSKQLSESDKSAFSESAAKELIGNN